MSIQGIDKLFNPIQDIKGLSKPKGLGEVGDKPEAGGFAEAFTEAINEVDQLQKSADKQVEAITTGAPGVTTHDAMIALEKADVAFQLMTQIRTKIIRAYEDIMRTQV